MKRIWFCAALFFAVFAFTARSQEPPTGTSQKKTIEKTPITPTSAASGEEMYMSYCAVCHGKAGKGDGPAASALKAPPADLTTLAKKNNGKYPADHVSSVLRFGVEAPAHGTKDMPTWGPLFRSTHPVEHGTELEELRIVNLSNYIKSLQTK